MMRPTESSMVSWEIRQGDALDLLRAMPDESVQCCVTSPPYWGLRDYGTAEWDGGNADCPHTPHIAYGEKSDTNRGSIRGGPFKGDCGKCGARRIDSQLGLEPTPDEYVTNLVAVFREVRRVLRHDGTLWLNLGDSYAGSWGAQSRPGNFPSGKSTLTTNSGRGPKAGDKYSALSATQIAAHPKRTNTGSIRQEGLKPKDLVGIPWRVAFALQADGWWLRSDIIWAKPNPMPESVTDRPTRSHEYIFLLSRNARYSYDANAIREDDGGRPAGNVNGFDRGDFQISRGDQGHGSEEGWTPGTGRNKRDVWEITTRPYPEAHFATFPPKLIEPCILAGSRPCQIVLDPFAGSGTTGLVALRHDRSFVGLELNPDYVELARRRICDDAPLLNTGLEVAA